VRAAEGQEVPVGTVIALVLAEGEAAAPPAEPAVPAAATAVAAPAPAPSASRSRPLAAPKARRVARERGLDLAAVAGSGPGGAVVAADLELAGAAGFEVGSVWRVMAERTQRSWQEVPHFVLRREVDATRLLGWKDAARAKPGCERVTVTDLLVRVCAAALVRHPRVNASWRDGAIVAGGGVNVAVAVATDDGLVAPVVHGADAIGLAGIAARRAAVVDAARSGRLRPDDVQGGTFTISNLGAYGVDEFQAIVNAPQAAILAVGRIAERPWVVQGALAVRPLLALSLSFDHRVVDGARGAEFLDTLAALVEEPAGLVD
jgi:pyruvate dehydrogenase E2 component (dihydrolipoyllysine-residue acetyltransferase)